MKKWHKTFVALIFGSVFAAPLAHAQVQAPAQVKDYPSRPLRLIVGFVPGGVADLLARALAQKLTDAWGQQVIVDNRPGGGGVISMQIVGKAAPDGYTLLMGSSTQFSINPALRSNLPYDPVRDYTPISNAAITPVILTVQATAAARSLADLIQWAKKDALSYGSTGYGGAPHIAGELLKRGANIPMTHVPRSRAVGIPSSPSWAGTCRPRSVRCLPRNRICAVHVCVRWVSPR